MTDLLNQQKMFAGPLSITKNSDMKKEEGRSCAAKSGNVKLNLPTSANLKID
jgi:hypothetical protein